MPPGGPPRERALHGVGDETHRGVADGGDVGADRGGGSPVGLHEHDLGGASAGGFEPEGARAGIEVEHSGVVEQAAVLEPAEQRLAHPVGGRAGRGPGGVRSRRPPALPQMMRVISPSLQPGRLLLVEAHGDGRRAGLGAVAARGPRRRARRRPRGPAAMTCSSSSSRTEPQVAHRVAASALASAQHIALAAQEQVEPGELETVGGGGDAGRAAPRPARPAPWSRAGRGPGDRAPADAAPQLVQL